MLEFYQAYATYEDLMDLTEEMLVGLARDVDRRAARCPAASHAIDLTPPWPRLTMAERSPSGPAWTPHAPRAGRDSAASSSAPAAPGAPGLTRRASSC